MNKTTIEWTNYVFNPIKGICPLDCKLPDGQSYCYARRFYQRFRIMDNYYNYNAFTGRNYSLEEDDLVFEYDLQDEDERKVEIKFPKKPSKIFVCSTIEIFHPKIPKEWRDKIFEDIEKYPQHTFQILTKLPKNIDRPMPENVWLGCSITRESEMHRMIELGEKQARIRFVSFEPLFEDVGDWTFAEIDWIVIGKLTGYGKSYNPKREWIQNIIDCARILERPVFLKNNLREIWGEKLIQEFPE